LYREDYYNKECENPNLAEAIILKNRKGATGTVELNWQPEYTSFTSLERRHGDEP
jgi:replicative DNA helicase